MFHFVVLADPRVRDAINDTHRSITLTGSKKPILDIIGVFLANLPALLPLLDDPRALISALLVLLGITPPPPPSPV